MGRLPQQSNKWPKLKPSQRVLLCSMLATGYSPTVVAQRLKAEYGIEITPRGVALYQTSPKWIPEIEKLKSTQEEFIAKHPLASKVNRLNILQDAINDASRQKCTKIVRDTKTGKVKDRFFKSEVGAIPHLVREARIEVEGEKPVVVVSNIDNSKKSLIQVMNGYNGLITGHKAADGNTQQGDSAGIDLAGVDPREFIKVA